ncbi:uncharacterized protein [Parasteatoda tepidariorum]|uniref:uncharacterized protein isoform X2 n=2 Tax=Parasteatoda tepidariorum TaxID=114398 RepID=UPI001C728C76|nr:uncharacterized protein LOC107450457 isoform X2 [Parasteatoda tepidariorum]
MIFSSHYDEGRIVSGDPTNHNLNVLLEESVQKFHVLEEEYGKKLFNNTGCLYLYSCEDESALKILSEINSGESQLLDISSKSLFSKEFPYMKFDSYKYAFFDTTSGHVSPREIIKAEKLVAEKNGCHIIDDIVKDIKEVDHQLIEIITESQRLIRTNKLLICAGAFTNFIPIFASRELNITVNKETYILIRISKEEAGRLSTMPTMDVFFESCEEQPHLYGAYILPPIKYPDGKYYLKIGHKGSIVNSELKNLKEIKNWYNCSGEKYISEHYSKIIQDLFPDLKFEEMLPKTCVTCSNPSELPYIDNISPNIIVAAVGNGSGVMMCEEIGSIAAELSVESTWNSKLSKSLFRAIFRS